MEIVTTIKIPVSEQFMSLLEPLAVKFGWDGQGDLNEFIKEYQSSSIRKGNLDKFSMAIRELFGDLGRENADMAINALDLAVIVDTVINNNL